MKKSGLWRWSLSYNIGITKEEPQRRDQEQNLVKSDSLFCVFSHRVDMHDMQRH